MASTTVWPASSSECSCWLNTARLKAFGAARRFRPARAGRTSSTRTPEAARKRRASASLAASTSTWYTAISWLSTLARNCIPSPSYSQLLTSASSPLPPATPPLPKETISNSRPSVPGIL